jgi:hypothetical protein
VVELVQRPRLAGLRGYAVRAAVSHLGATLRGERIFLLSFPYVSPEPVWVK